MSLLTWKFALYFVAVVSALVAVAGGVGGLANDPSAMAIAFVVAAAVVSALCLWLSWRLDRVAFARFVVVMGSLAVIMALAVVVVWDTLVPGAVVTLLLATIIGGSTGAWLWRYYRAADPVPDLLREQFPEPLITERVDVQVVFLISASTIPPLGTVETRIYLQNCCRGPRRVRFSLLPKRPVLGGSKGSLTVAPPGSVDLEPAEVGYWTVPVQASEDAAGPFDLWLDVSVSGSRGARIRKRHARQLPVRWPWWFRALALVGGHWLAGGGIKGRIEVAAGGAPGDADPTVGARWHRLYPVEACRGGETFARAQAAG